MGRKKVLNEGGEIKVIDLSMADLYALYLFVGAHRSKGFNIIPNETKTLIDHKFVEIEDELYRRAYGCNPFKKVPLVVYEGMRPEDIDLDKFEIKDKDENKTNNFVVTKNENIESKDVAPQVFAVFKNE